MRDFVAYGAAKLTLDTASADGPALERYFSRRGLAFRTRLFDLRMIGYNLIGGRVHRLNRRPSALFAYRGPNGQKLVCEMYEGRTADLPSGGEAVSHGGIEFRIFRRQGFTMVFWQEGPVVCVLVSNAPTQDVVAFAYAKAAKS